MSRSHTVPSRERPVFTLRLSHAERRLLEAAAAARQVYLSEFIRDNAMAAARAVVQNVGSDPAATGGD